MWVTLTKFASLSGPVRRRHDARRSPPILSCVLGVSALIGTACSAQVSSAGPLPSHPPDHTQDCPRLDSQLFQLSRSVDPAKFASGAGLELNSSGARVVVELATGADMPSGHGVVVEAQYANMVQARVPVADLCGLAQESAVVGVVPPTHGVPQTSRP
jgi:hypothetical protein